MVWIEDSDFAGLDSVDTNETLAPEPQMPKLIGFPSLGSFWLAQEHKFWDLPVVLASADEESSEEEEEEDDFDYFDDEDEEDDELDEEDEFEEEEFEDEEEEDEEEDDEDF